MPATPSAIWRVISRTLVVITSLSSMFMLNPVQLSGGSMNTALYVRVIKLNNIAAGDVFDEAVLADSSILIVGTSYHYTSTSALTPVSRPYIAKLDPAGNLVWAKRHDFDSATWINGASYGGTYFAVEQLSAERFIAVGVFSIFRPLTQVLSWCTLLTMHDANGSPVWSKCLPFRTFQPVVTRTRDGGFAIFSSKSSRAGGFNDDRAYVARFTASGDVVWQLDFDDAVNNTFRSGVANADGTLTALGIASTPGSASTGWLLKISEQGQVLTQSSIKSASAFPTRIIAADAENYFLSSSDAVSKITSDGDVIWHRALSDSDAPIVLVNDIAKMQDGGVIVSYVAKSPSTASFPSGFGYFSIARISTTGELLWYRRYGDSQMARQENALTVAGMPDGGVFAGGWSASNTRPNLSVGALLMRTDADGLIGPSCTKLLTSMATPAQEPLLTITPFTRTLATLSDNSSVVALTQTQFDTSSSDDCIHSGPAMTPVPTIPVELGSKKLYLPIARK
jgi:hypothetical protein